MSADTDFPGLGPFSWCEETSAWYGEVDLRPGQRIVIVVEYEPGELSELDTLRRAYRILLGLPPRVEDYRRWTVDDLGIEAILPGLTTGAVFDYLSLSSLCVNSDGTAALEWEHPDIYHGVVTSLGRKGEFLRAELGG